MIQQSYVRTEMLPQQAAPLTERGAVKWLRENLFSGPFNTILTILGLVVLFYLVRAILPWLMNSVWNANSLAECRQIIAETAGEGASGACWAPIRERWHQWLFGFYPQDLYWRPVLALVLLFVALAPVLFERVPKQLLWFTLIYPAVCFWLLWGGSVWVPAFTVIGLGVTVLFAFFNPLRLGSPWLLLGAVLIFLAVFLDPVSAILDVIGGIAGIFTDAGVDLDWGVSLGETRYSARDIFPLLPHTTGVTSAILPIGLQPVASDQFGGFLLAVTIGVTAIAFSLPLGVILALGRQSDMMIVKVICVGFIEFIRGVPLITLLFTASLLLQYFLPPGTNFDIILRVIILVTLFAAAYLAEVIRGGLAALPRGQYEAADALGLDYWRAQRLIILPQALKISIPSIVSTFIGLFKDTTLVSFVGLLDPLRGVTNIVRADINWKGIYWEPYIFVGAIFFVFCFGMSRYSMYLEQRLKTDHR
jgi:general L-amino acid transport system permease protein